MKMLWVSRGLQRVTVCTSLLLVASTASAENLKPIDVFKRCYIRMVRSVPVESDTLYKQVAAGSIGADAACLALFDRAQFGTDGILKLRTSEEAKNIVRTFHDLHSSWFQSKTNSLSRTALLVRDNEEAPLYFTRAALQQGVAFNSVTTLNKGLKGVRDQETYPNERKDFVAQRLALYSPEAPYFNETDLILSYIQLRYADKVTITKEPELDDEGKPVLKDGKPVLKEIKTVTSVLVNDGTLPLRRPQGAISEVGQLVGVGTADPLILPSFRPIASAFPDVMKASESMMVNFDANKHLGGGIIGSQAFIANNVNLGTNVLPDTYTLINRRLSARVFEDLLCHQLPTLEDADVAGEVKPDSEHTFQRTSSCMRCHSGIDGMAYGYRNVFTYISAGIPLAKDSVGLFFQGITALTPSAKATTFVATMPEGRLHYRELVTKARRDFKFSSLAQLGSQLAVSNDLYTCAAKRYYEFFTGINVDMTKAATAQLDKLHQDKVIALGKAFKSHQSVRLLLKDIFASDAFRASNYLSEK